MTLLWVFPKKAPRGMRAMRVTAMVAILIFRKLNLYTEQLDVEGLGRKLLLTPSGDPAEPLKSRPWVLSRHLTKR